jgi:hypothetical protein
MIRNATLLLLAAGAYIAPSAALAQVAPPTYVGDPGVYKVIFEDPAFRVMTGTWKPGQADKPHSHPVPSIVYSLSNCTLKLTSAGGETRIVKNRAGHAMAVPFTASHVAKNIGPTTCRVLFVEHK